MNDRKMMRGMSILMVLLALVMVASGVQAQEATDNEYTESEQTLIDNLLSNQLNITLEEAQILRIKGEGLEAEINDNVQLTRIIKQDIPYEEREMLIEQLWSVVLDDDYRTPEENKFMRVLTHLFGISDVNSAKARSRVLAKK